MKRFISVFMAVILTTLLISGCAGGKREYVDVENNSYISEYTENVTTVYQETKNEGLELYNRLFDLDNKISVDIFMTTSEIGKLQSDFQNYTENDENKKSETYRKADVTFTIGSDVYTIEEVGIRLKGNQTISPLYSYDGTPNLCSFKLSFDETFDDEAVYSTDVKEWASVAEKEARKKRTFASLDKLDIKWNVSYDKSNIREIYAAKLFESADQLVQKIGLSQMKFNGNNYGLVKIYEPVDKKFLEKRLPKSALGGDLYKCMWSECDNTGKRTGEWRGVNYNPDNSYGIQNNSEGIKFNFNLKTNKKTSKHESLIKFLDVINKQDITKEELETVLDVDSYAGFMAAEYFAGDPDDMRNNFNNHYIYFRKDDGKAIFIVYDNDRTLGITYGLNKNCAVVDPYADTAVTMGEQLNPLIKSTVTHNIPENLSYVRDKYTAALDKLSKTEMLTSDEDFNKMYNKAKANYEDIVEPYMQFANQRSSFAFSLDGDKKGGQNTNMSFEQFRSQIMETYKNSTP